LSEGKLGRGVEGIAAHVLDMLWHLERSRRLCADSDLQYYPSRKSGSIVYKTQDLCCGPDPLLLWLVVCDREALSNPVVVTIGASF
jgi:hypothetical protein